MHAPDEAASAATTLALASDDSPSFSLPLPLLLAFALSLADSANSACHLESSVSSGWKLVASRFPCLTATVTLRGIEGAAASAAAEAREEQRG